MPWFLWFREQLKLQLFSGIYEMKIILQEACLKDNLDSVGTMNINVMETCFVIQGGFFLHSVSTFLPYACVFEDLMKRNLSDKIIFLYSNSKSIFKLKVYAQWERGLSW